MIRFIVLQNRQGKTRLAKYYVPLEDSEKHKVEYEVRSWFGSLFLAVFLLVEFDCENLLVFKFLNIKSVPLPSLLLGSSAGG
uniref:Uncharacterized protein MANES_16G099600 n=1 Tax=Rhizophora mucronata TaxID=61149 RepID=A0A2P2MI89_RHIMU